MDHKVGSLCEVVDISVGAISTLMISRLAFYLLHLLRDTRNCGDFQDTVANIKCAVFCW